MKNRQRNKEKVHRHTHNRRRAERDRLYCFVWRRRRRVCSPSPFVSHPQSFFCIFLSKRIINRNGVYFIYFIFLRLRRRGICLFRPFPFLFNSPGVSTCHAEHACWNERKLTRHAHFVATRADLSPSLFFSQPTNQPSSAGIVTFGEQIIKKEKRNKRKYNGRWEYLSSSFSYSIK